MGGVESELVQANPRRASSTCRPKPPIPARVFSSTTTSRAGEALNPIPWIEHSVVPIVPVIEQPPGPIRHHQKEISR